jgi:hypothetical protein
VANLVAVSFSGFVFAAETIKTDIKTETTTTSPAGDVKVEKSGAKKAIKKHKKHHYQKAVKKSVSAPVGPASEEKAIK